MVLQRSADFRTVGPLPETISFVLPGRRTLSEHLPAEIVDVLSRIAQRSTYLHSVIVQQGLTYPSTWQFPLPKIDSIGFRMYVEWLESGHIEFNATSLTVSSGGLLLRDAFDLMFAHIAGSQLEEPDFQDYVLDTMTKLLDVSQTPDLKVLEVVFLENGASNVLKQFIVDKMFAVERKMLGMMRGRADDAEERQREIGCKYHVHELGECYRGRLRDDFEYSSDLSHVGHGRSRSNTLTDHSAHPRSTSPSSSSSDSLTSTLSDSANYNMPNDPYFGSVKWSREVHDLERRNTTPDLRINKPLPNIPPLTLGPSPTSPLSPSSLFRVLPPFQDRSRSESDSTQQLVFECLSRLPPVDGNLRSRSESEPDLHRAAIPGLVLECLERFRNSYSDGSSSGTESASGVTSSNPAFERNHLPTLQEQSSPLTSSNPSPEPKRRVHWEKSYDTLPKPWQEPGARIAKRAEPQSEIATRQEFQNQQQSPIERAKSTTIKRKSAPPRGTDWLKQYDRINDLMRGAPTVVAKRSRRSRFKELLRSESRMGSVKFES